VPVHPVVFNKVAYYTTFAPTVPNPDDPCFVGEGTARVYAVTHMLGNPVFNLDLTSEALTKEDRSTVIGTAIPSGVIITIIGGKAVGYVGVGGGVYIPQLPSTRTSILSTGRSFSERSQM
jgi:type IV pilus assembly protein PilY1